MDDMAYRRFFAEPAQTYHRQYEALRAIFFEQRSQKQVAEEFGFQYATLRQLAYEFRKYCDAGPEMVASPFFAQSSSIAPASESGKSQSHRLRIGRN
jgi:hypothetical protein